MSGNSGLQRKKEISFTDRINVKNFPGCLIQNFKRSIFNKKVPIKIIVFKNATFQCINPEEFGGLFLLSGNGPYFEGTFNYLNNIPMSRDLPEFFFGDRSFSFELVKENLNKFLFQLDEATLFTLDDFDSDMRNILFKGFGLTRRVNKFNLTSKTIAERNNRIRDIDIIIGIIRGRLGLSDRL